MSRIYKWKDIVLINGIAYAEEFEIGGETDKSSDGDVYYHIGNFLQSVADKYCVDIDDIKTYMMDNIDFDPQTVAWGAEDCGCYIDGKAEWLFDNPLVNEYEC